MYLAKIMIIVYMPIIIKKLPSSRGYMVQNALTKVIHAKHTTLKKAEAQKRLIDAIDRIRSV